MNNEYNLKVAYRILNEVSEELDKEVECLNAQDSATQADMRTDLVITKSRIRESMKNIEGAMYLLEVYKNTKEGECNG